MRMSSDSHRTRSRRLTLGILAGWQVYHIYLNSYLEGVYNGIQAAAEVYDANLLFACGINQIEQGINSSKICPAWPEISTDSTFVPVSQHNTDALIAISPLLSPQRAENIRCLMNAGFPVILIGSGDGSPAIMYDQKAGIMQAVAHLVEHGHRRIAFVGGHPAEMDRDSRFRLEAYREAVRLHDLDDDPQLVVYGRHSHDGGSAAMQSLLGSGAPFTAVVASNDESAIGAMRVCKAAGIRVPDDIAFVGFDNRLEAAAQEPALSTVQVPLFEVGFRACETLIQHLRGKTSLADLRDDPIPVRLVLRESCGCAPQRGSTASIGAPVVVGGQSTEQTLQTIVSEMTDQVSADITHISHLEILDNAQQLMESFAAAVHSDAPTLFLIALLRTLTRMEGLREIPSAWQNALSRLEASLPAILALWGLADRYDAALRLLFEGQSLIGKRARQQHIETIISADGLADQLGQLNAYLASLMDEGKILDILANQLPQLGLSESLVSQIDVVFLDLRDGLPETSLLATQSRQHFPTSEFPPSDLYPDQRQVIALLPLVIENEQIGYVAFSHAQLKICANMVRGIATALHTAKLYHRAVTAQQMAEEANRMKSRFLATVSHELRTPLDVIVGSSDVLMKELTQQGLSAEPLEDLTQIQASARHLNSLITDVLDLTKSEAGHLSLTCELLDLSETFKPILEVAQQTVEKRGLRWIAAIQDDLPHVWGDRVRLRQVILNLVSNAAKFTDSGEVRLEVAVSDGLVAIAVSDTGIGVSADEQQHIFSEFQQSARTAGRAYQGLGLGLTICRRLVEMHGGTISVQSAGEDGKGSIFRVLLPPIEAQRPQSTNRSGERVVLLVDDDPISLRSHERILATQLANSRILKAHSGQEALNLVSIDTPDLIILDLVMPELDGFGLVEALREHPATHSIPLIVLSGKTLSEDDVKRLSKGVVSILSKGVFTAEDIVSHAESALSGQHRIGDSTQTLVRSAIAYVHQNYMRPITREDIARYVSINEDYLTTCFQRELGISPIAYLNRYRISRAKILMKTTAMSLTEIALEVGFGSSTYFSRIFRRETGVSPSEYRAR